jgi:tRNA threonylcarbamoyladenosine biosynthesis protein TsaB
MKILAVETSTMLGGLAIAEDSKGLIAELRLNVKSTHSERLMTEIDHVLKQSGTGIDDIDVFGAAIGPGSFTGLRIGLSTVKGFSYATGKPIVAVPTLEALAWNFPFSLYPVCTVLDARKKEVYAALFQWNDESFSRLIQEISVKVDRLIEKIDELSKDKVIFAGEGALLYKGRIIEALGEKAVFPAQDKMAPSPANVASVGLHKAFRGEFSEPVNLAPFYVRRSEAEIKRAWLK